MDPKQFHDLNTPERILLGPGPSNIPARVLAALSQPVVGHLDPSFLSVMDDTQQLLRYLFQTENKMTLPVSGTGSAGMETALSNLIEPGDKVLIGVIGYFGLRMADMARRYGADVDLLEVPWGQVLDPDEVTAALNRDKYKLLALVHGETSSGARQPHIRQLAEAAHASGALLVMDTVASLGGTPVKVDDWDVDLAFSGSQKAISAPPGLAPITIGQRALKVIEKRQSPVGNWYLDLSELQKYWGHERTYHHTAPVNLNFALREALRLVFEEGLEARFARHQGNAEELWQGLEELDLALLVASENRLPTLTTVQTPHSADANEVKDRLLAEYNIEVAGGFGPLAGKIWRLGLMGHGSRNENVTLLLAALRNILSQN